MGNIIQNTQQCYHQRDRIKNWELVYLIIDKARELKHGLVAVGNSKAIYSEDMNIEKLGHMGFDEFLLSLMDIEGVRVEINVLKDDEEAVIIIGEPTHTKNEYYLLSKMLRKLRINTSNEIISSLICVPLRKHELYKYPNVQERQLVKYFHKPSAIQIYKRKMHSVNLALTGIFDGTFKVIREVMMENNTCKRICRIYTSDFNIKSPADFYSLESKTNKKFRMVIKNHKIIQENVVIDHGEKPSNIFYWDVEETIEIERPLISQLLPFVTRWREHNFRNQNEVLVLQGNHRNSDYYTYDNNIPVTYDMKTWLHYDNSIILYFLAANCIRHAIYNVSKSCRSSTDSRIINSKILPVIDYEILDAYLQSKHISNNTLVGSISSITKKQAKTFYRLNEIMNEPAVIGLDDAIYIYKSEEPLLSAKKIRKEYFNAAKKIEWKIATLLSESEMPLASIFSLMILKNMLNYMEEYPWNGEESKTVTMPKLTTKLGDSKLSNKSKIPSWSYSGSLCLRNENGINCINYNQNDAPDQLLVKLEKIKPKKTGDH